MATVEFKPTPFKSRQTPKEIILYKLHGDLSYCRGKYNLANFNLFNLTSAVVIYSPALRKASKLIPCLESVGRLQRIWTP
jgi:hypothetical protein